MILIVIEEAVEPADAGRLALELDQHAGLARRGLDRVDVLQLDELFLDEYLAGGTVHAVHVIGPLSLSGVLLHRGLPCPVARSISQKSTVTVGFLL
jgi:hypothetical protein